MALATTDLLACLPESMRQPGTTVTRVGAGMSGAGVYRVEAEGRAYVLKVASTAEPVTAWTTRLAIHRDAAAAGLAPPLVHVDETRRAVLSAFVVDRSFPMLFFMPATREAALGQLATTLRRVHALPIPEAAAERDVHAFLRTAWTSIEQSGPAPAFVTEAVERALAVPPPARAGAAVLCHHDVNPSNLVYDGTQLFLLDWDTAGPGDPYYDLATIAAFLRMDDETCCRLVGVHDGAPVTALPASFAYYRWFVPVACGAVMLMLARAAGHAGDPTAETLESTLTLGEYYQQMRAGAVDPGTPAGQYRFGLALVKTGAVM